MQVETNLYGTYIVWWRNKIGVFYSNYLANDHMMMIWCDGDDSDDDDHDDDDDDDKK